MPVGFAPAFADQINNFVFRGVSFTPPTTYFVKLHTGDPGVAGTANAAGNTTRKAATFGSTSSGGNLSNTAAPVWSTSEVNTDETYSHASLWDAATAGTFKMSGMLPVPRNVDPGGTFSIPIGDIDITLNVAS